MLTPSAEGFSVLIVELLTCLRGGEPRGRAGWTPRHACREVQWGAPPAPL